MAEEPARSGLSPKASLTIALAGIGATLIAAIAASWLTGHQQDSLQDKNIVAQAATADRAELRGVVDEAATAVLRAENASSSVIAPGTHPTIKQIDTLSARIRAMSLPRARLTTRLGDQHPLTKAYAATQLAFRNEVACTAGRKPDQDRGGSFTNEAIGYFNIFATVLVGSRVGPPRSIAVPSAQAIDHLNEAIVHAIGKCDA